MNINPVSTLCAIKASWRSPCMVFFSNCRLQLLDWALAVPLGAGLSSARLSKRAVRILDMHYAIDGLFGLGRALNAAVQPGMGDVDPSVAVRNNCAEDVCANGNTGVWLNRCGLDHDSGGEALERTAESKRLCIRATLSKAGLGEAGSG
ncbi:hypothetical protein GJV26_03190 [Massilia dura]|uniref:Uncharacterized protein n=1 Tax=Pseudoduganella dura TaxID=321982 RepID=A0A6I3X3T3_9BURK|nr:hypothetical protein [Pseudoduganella dura]MUI11499.1 hypothetical protein [Pseudoduganella dura]